MTVSPPEKLSDKCTTALPLLLFFFGRRDSASTPFLWREWMTSSQQRQDSNSYFLYFCTNVQKKVTVVTVECVWLMAGLQPHLAWVRLIGLWLGGAADLWCMSNHGTQDKPAINTHTLRSWQHVPSAQQIPSCHLQYMHSTTSTCVGGPQQKPLRWRVAVVNCHSNNLKPLYSI